jgi:cobalt-zinc-cadmium efflux system membrane fusion protein
MIEAHMHFHDIKLRNILAPVGILVLVAVAAVVLVSSRGAKRDVPTTPSSLPRLEGAAILLPEAFMQVAGIASQPVERRSIMRRVAVSGQVGFDPEQVAVIGTRARGVVDQVLKFEGDVVQRNEMLARIDSPDLSHAQGVAMALAAQMAAAQANMRREQSLHREGMTTTRELELATAVAAQHRAELAAARAKVATLAREGTQTMGMYALRTPLAGVVVERTLHTGQAVEENIMAFRVANLDQLWVELAVSERHLAGVKRGDAVDIRPIAHPEDRLDGQVAYVGDVIDPLTGTAPVRVKLANRDRKLRPGQTVTATIRLGQADSLLLAVPESAVTLIDGKPHVFMELAPRRVQPTPVELGASDDGWVEIRSGLQAGDRIVTSGVFALKSELFR